MRVRIYVLDWLERTDIYTKSGSLLKSSKRDKFRRKRSNLEIVTRVVRSIKYLISDNDFSFSR